MSELFENKSFERGDFIYKSKDEPEKIFFMKSGKVLTFSSIDKKIIPLGLLEKNEVFGAAQVLSDEAAYNHFAYCMERSEVLEISKNEIDKSLSEKANWIQDLVKGMSRKLSSTMSFITSHKMVDTQTTKGIEIEDSEMKVIARLLKE